MNAAEPNLRDPDLLVDIRAVNPGEALIRSMRSAEAGGRVVLGFEFAGVVIGIGSQAEGFAMGDSVMGTGDVTRDGCWGERLAVDHRVVAKIPDRLSFADAASLPIGGLTAWEAMLRERDALPSGVDRVLVIGGAGGVGSMAIQLLKAKTAAFVIATASRPESEEWCETMGADLVINHSRDVVGQLGTAGIDHVDIVFSTAHTARNLSWIAKSLRPFGHLSAVDIAPPFDASQVISKSVSIHTEMLFAKKDQRLQSRRSGQNPGRDRLPCPVWRAAPDRDDPAQRPICSKHEDGARAARKRRTIGKIVIVA
jgi:zinc-binding alcohol dehydrogenase family protein